MIKPLPLTPDPETPINQVRIKRLPLVIVFLILLVALVVLVWGLSSRGIIFGQDADRGATVGPPATSFADKMKAGVSNAIIGDEKEKPEETPIVVRRREPPDEPRAAPIVADVQRPKDDWRGRLKREQDEQIMRERGRMRLSRLQAEATARDAPLKIDISSMKVSSATTSPVKTATSTDNRSALSVALKASEDQNGQDEKQAFLNSGNGDSGVLANKPSPPRSPFELKRGAVIPATLITGINSDLPGRIIAQVSQNVYDSASGHRLLIPQGAKLQGRYDSKVSYGQSRVLVVWTDLIFPNGKTLQINAMAGVDAAGYGGFSDEVDHHYFRTFGSAALIALIGTGIDLAMPATGSLYGTETASDAAKRNFAQTMGQVAEQTISKGLNNQPTIEIRPGYQFNVLVDRDINFGSAYSRS